MKDTGMVKQIDKLGRVVIPMGIRKSMNVKDEDSFLVSVDKGRIILEPYSPGCIFCGKNKNLTEYKDKKICTECKAELSN